ncbi:MAG TPA: hypothetical protein VEA99_13040 [Gemmatimonadaceae bacterium]|nr:hypothetical protein [Gemmatimonadaceae bacterium]
MQASKRASALDGRARTVLDKLYLALVEASSLAGELKGQVGPESPYAAALVRLDPEAVRKLIKLQIEVTKTEELRSRGGRVPGIRREIAEEALFAEPVMTAGVRGDLDKAAPKVLADLHRRTVLYVLEDADMLDVEIPVESTRSATREGTLARMAAAASLAAGGALPSCELKTPAAVLEQEAQLMRAAAIRNDVLDLVPPSSRNGAAKSVVEAGRLIEQRRQLLEFLRSPRQ